MAVARAKEGEDDAIRFLYVSYSNNVYGYVRSIVHDDHEAEDVTQHVFAKLMTKKLEGREATPCTRESRRGRCCLSGAGGAQLARPEAAMETAIAPPA